MTTKQYHNFNVNSLVRLKLKQEGIEVLAQFYQRPPRPRPHIGNIKHYDDGWCEMSLRVAFYFFGGESTGRFFESDIKIENIS